MATYGRPHRALAAAAAASLGAATTSAAVSFGLSASSCREARVDVTWLLYPRTCSLPLHVPGTCSANGQGRDAILGRQSSTAAREPHQNVLCFIEPLPSNSTAV